MSNQTAITTGTTGTIRPKILLLGDSLTQLSFSSSRAGWGAHLADVYQRRADVINRGNSGYNTEWYLNYCNSKHSDVFTQHVDAVRLIIIFFGANDSACSVLNPRQHVPLGNFKTNLTLLIELCHNHYPNAKILVMACPPVHHQQRLQFQKEKFGSKATGKLERNMDLSKQYSDAAQNVATTHKLPCLNLHKEMQTETSSWGDFFYDGLHFSRAGNEYVGAKLVETINEALPEFKVTNGDLTPWANSASTCPALPQDGPYHDEIDHNDPSSSFGGRAGSPLKKKLKLAEESAD